jgi:hypothetical protein
VAATLQANPALRAVAASELERALTDDPESGRARHLIEILRPHGDR